MAAETVAWLPQTLAPQAGAHWSGIDDSRASVTIKGPGRPVDIVVEVDARGDLRTLQPERWNTAKKPHGPELFGSATNEKFTTSDGVVISGDGTVGWGTPARREFFTYRIRSATSM